VERLPSAETSPPKARTLTPPAEPDDYSRMAGIKQRSGKRPKTTIAQSDQAPLPIKRKADAQIHDVAIYHSSVKRTLEAAAKTDVFLQILVDYGCDAVLGWNVHLYVDLDTSSRPDFERLMADARGQKFDLVLFWHYDFFSPDSARKTIDTFLELEGLGIGWRSITALWAPVVKQIVEPSSLRQLRELVIEDKSEFVTRWLASREYHSEKSKKLALKRKLEGKRLGRLPKVSLEIIEMLDHKMPPDAIKARLGRSKKDSFYRTSKSWKKSKSESSINSQSKTKA
jgi:hypothetical protein